MGWHHSAVRVMRIEGKRCEIDEPYQGWISMQTKDGSVILEHIDSIDSMNLISDKLFNVFYNVSNLVIDTGAWGSECSYPLNMVHFIDVINEISKLRTVRIKQIVVSEKDSQIFNSWIAKYWKTASSKLIDQCKKYGMQIQYREVVRTPQRTEFQLDIIRL